MVRRHSSWIAGLSQDLRDPEFVREFLIATVEDGDDIQKALGFVARTMGVKEFAEEVGMPSSNVLRAINHGHNPTMATLEKMLRPFGVRLSLAKTTTPKPRRAARASRSR